MSQTTLPPDSPPAPGAVHKPVADLPGGGSTYRPPREELDFEYRPVPVLAPVSLFMGLCGFAALMSVTGVVVAVAGIVLSGFCLWQIARSKGELGGRGLALSGLVFASVFLIAGSGMHYYDYKTELPPGYQRVNFPQEIAEKGFLQTVDVLGRPQLALHPDVKPLIDQKVFLKGWVWNSRVSENMAQFVLLKDNGECCMGGAPAPNDMIVIQMQDGKTFDYVSGLVSVAGTLRADPDGPRTGRPVYVIEADLAEKARSTL